MRKIVGAALLSAVMSTPVYSAGFFLGADIGSTGGYPDRTGETVNALIGFGASSASATQKKASLGFSVRVGQWVTDRFGWELGYNGFGSIDGSWTSVGATTGSYKYTASAAHLAVLGGIPVGSGKIYGKAGLYSASTKEEASNTVGYSASKTHSSSGLLIGGGYEWAFTGNLSGHAGVNLFNGVKFNNFVDNTTTNKTLAQVAVGVDFKF